MTTNTGVHDEGEAMDEPANTNEADPRECGWLGCGHPSCADLCAGVPLAEWREWKAGRGA